MCDCGFTKDNDWFRYRVGAIIVEKDCVLVATNRLEDYFCREHYGIEHIVSDERIYTPVKGTWTK